MQRLSGLDAGFLYMETPTVRMHTLKVAVLDPPPGEPLDFESVKVAIGEHLDLLPPLRRRVVDVPGRLHHPMWVDDPEFDLSYHIHRVILPSPGTHAQLDRAIGEIAGRPLDRARPLWQMHVFEGLEGGRIAVLITVHHALADGVAATALLANVMSTMPGGPRAAALAGASGPEPTRVAGPRTREVLPSRSWMIRDAMNDRVHQLAHLPRLLVRTLGGLLSLLRRRRRSEVVTPVPILSTPRSSFNTSLTARRSFATVALDLGDARAVRSACGVTLNDVVLAIVGGALRRYLDDRGELPDRPLVAAVPVSSDPDVGRLEGNRVSNLFASLATDEVDPLRRLDAIHAVMSEAKAVQRIMGAETLANWIEYTPPGPYEWFNKHYSGWRVADRHPPPINVIVSNVPGPREPLQVAGAVLREIYSVGPILEGVGLNITVWSYCDQLFVGVLACGDTVPEPWRITEAMTEALAELVAAVAVRVGPDAPGP